MYYVKNKRQKKSIAKVLAENIACYFHSGINYLHHRDEAKTILFYPQFPSRQSVIHKATRRLRYNLTNNPERDHHLTVYWHNTTYREPDSTIISLAETERVVNINCTDISKSRVDKAFHDVFGYSCAVDSRTYHGLLVKKSEINALHDGEIVQGPVEPEDGFIYQKLVNNSVDNQQVADMRIPIVKGEIPLVYIKYKPISKRFSHYRKSKNKTKKPQMHAPEQLLNSDEIAKIKLFCEQMGLDYGEVDVLRDNDDKKIYIVDVNNTPYGPSVGKLIKRQGVGMIADMFKAAFFR